MYPFPASSISSPTATNVRPIGKNIRVPPARREVFGGPGSGDPDGSPGHMSCFETTGGAKTCPKKCHLPPISGFGSFNCVVVGFGSRLLLLNF